MYRVSNTSMFWRQTVRSDRHSAGRAGCIDASSRPRVVSIRTVTTNSRAGDVRRQVVVYKRSKGDGTRAMPIYSSRFPTCPLRSIGEKTMRLPPLQDTDGQLKKAFGEAVRTTPRVSHCCRCDIPLCAARQRSQAAGGPVSEVCRYVFDCAEDD